MSPQWVIRPTEVRGENQPNSNNSHVTEAIRYLRTKYRRSCEFYSLRRLLSALAFSDRLVVIDRVPDTACSCPHIALYSQAARDGLVVLQVDTASLDFALNSHKPSP